MTIAVVVVVVFIDVVHRDISPETRCLIWIVERPVGYWHGSGQSTIYCGTAVVVAGHVVAGVVVVAAVVM